MSVDLFTVKFSIACATPIITSVLPQFGHYITYSDPACTGIMEIELEVK